jgi:DNA-binding LacI/PurR family transcriptional regulator
MIISKERPHIRVASDIEAKIQSGQIKDGEQIAPESQLSAYYKTSLRVIRNAMSELEARDIIFRQKGKGTFVRRSEKVLNPRSLSAAVIFNQTLCVSNMARLAGIAETLKENNIGLFVTETGHLLEKEIEAVEECRGKCDGIILVSVASEQTVDYLKLLSEQDKRKIVLVDRFFHKISLNCVTCDHFDGVYKAAVHMHDSGYKKIAYAGSSFQIFSVHERIMGFVKAAQTFAPGENPLILQKGTNMHTAGHESAKELLTTGKADAMVCENDDIAIGALTFLKEAGVRPGKDFGLIGFDDSESVVHTTLGLSSVNAKCQETGRIAAAILSETLLGRRDGQQAQKIVLPVEITERDSSRRN